MTMIEEVMLPGFEPERVDPRILPGFDPGWQPQTCALCGVTSRVAGFGFHSDWYHRECWPGRDEAERIWREESPRSTPPPQSDGQAYASWWGREHDRRPWPGHEECSREHGHRCRTGHALEAA